MQNNTPPPPLTQGSILHSAARFALPFLAAYLLQTLYGLGDLFLVGKFAAVKDTTAVAIGSQLMHVVTVLCVALATGTTVLVGRATGRGDKRAVCSVIGNTAVLFAAAGIIATAVLSALAPQLVSAMSTPAEAVRAAQDYISICALGIPAIAIYNAAASALRGMGDSKTPLIFVAIACTVNIALDCILVGFCRMQAKGAAVATVASQSLSVIALTVYVRRSKAGSTSTVSFPPLHRADFVPRLAVLRSLLVLGIPVMLQDGFIQLSFIIITIIANARGITDSAAVGIVEKVISIMFLVPSSMLSTVSVLASQCLGAGDEERARLSLAVCIKISVAWGLALCAVTMPFAPFIVGAFTRDSAVAASGGAYLRSYVWDCVLAGVHFCFSGYFCALGKPYLSFVHNVISAFLVRIPLAYLLSSHFSASLLPMGFAPPAGSLVSVLLCSVMYCLQRKYSGKLSVKDALL